MWICPSCNGPASQNVDYSKGEPAHYCDGPCVLPAPRAVTVAVVPEAELSELRTVTERLVEALEKAYEEDWAGADDHPTAQEFQAVLASARAVLRKEHEFG